MESEEFVITKNRKRQRRIRARGNLPDLQTGIMICELEYPLGA